jgi:hypothetical protein
VAGRNEGEMTGWTANLAMVGVAAIGVMLGDFFWGAALAITSAPLTCSPGIFTAFSYGLFGGDR